LFESNDSPIFLVSHSGKILEVNPAAAKLFPANNGNVGMNDFGADANDSNERFELVRKQLHEYRGDLDLSAIVGQDAARELLARGKAYVDGKSMAGMRNDDGSIAGSGVPSVEIRCGEGIYLFRPSVTAIYDEYSQPILQVILEDVTSEAVSLKNAELYARNVLGAQEDERKRLAQELHDGPLQSLIHLCRQVDAASGNREGKKQELEQVREVAEGVVSELRSIARGLRPSILDDLGLVTAISRLLSELEERTGIKTTLGVHGIEWRLQPQVESCLFRVAQEALSNVERHSHATHVAVGLERDRGNVHFLVNDDGDGFETDTVNPSSSNTMGMVGMRERVSLLGGRLYIRSTPRSGVNGAVTGVLPEHTGTSIEVFLPYLPSYAEEASSQ
jgi:signal transduction histidine kinase